MLSLSATHVGSFAHDIAVSDGQGDVIAVFAHSFYVLAPKGIFAVCHASLGNGPINVLIPSARAEPAWQGRVREGQKVEVSTSRLTIVGALNIDLSTAAIWSPPPPATFDPARGAASCSVIRQWFAGLPPLADGLAPLVLSDAPPQTPTQRAAAAQISTLANARQDAIARRLWPTDALSAATLLVGLGPGLTPSGDDLLGGLMLALSFRGELRLRDQLWDHIVDDLDALTVPVSAMHLTAAAHGLGHEAMHALLNTCLAGSDADMVQCLDAVAEIGATSGLDAIAGVYLGLSA